MRRIYDLHLPNLHTVAYCDLRPGRAGSGVDRILRVGGWEAAAYGGALGGEY